MTASSTPLPESCDVLVCGGGLAGIGAALAAARRGAETLLVEQTEILGGLGASGGVGNFSAAAGGHRGQGRVYADILDGLRAAGGTGEEHGWPVWHDRTYGCENLFFDHQALPLVLLDLAERAGLRCLFATTVCGARAAKGRIEEVFLHNRSLLRSVSASVVVDATGDGIAVRHAGATVLPEDPEGSGVVQPGFMIYLRKAEEAPLQPVPAPPRYAKGTAPQYSVWREPRGRVGLKMRLFETHAFDTGTGAGYNEALLAMRRRVPEVVRHFQEHHDASYVFDFASPMLGLREGRRVEGDTVLTVDDLRAGRRFDDAVAYGTFTLDANGVREVVPLHTIPLRCLVVRGLVNALVAGRCLSADSLALSSARVMPTACLTGQAAGLAAARAAETDCPVRAVAAETVRSDLLEDAADAEGLREGLAGMPRR